MFRRNDVVGLVMALGVGMALILSIMGQMTPAASAKSAPLIIKQPARQGDSTITWSIEDRVFESNYPEGFSSQIKATSSAGDIVRARLVWHQPKLRESEVLTVFAEEGEYDPSTGTFSAGWSPNGGLMLPPWSVIAYRWDLRDEAGNWYETDVEVVEYADLTRPWTRSESEDVIVFSSDLSADIEDLVLDAMAAQHQKYVDVWGALLPYKPRVVLFGDYSAWKEWRTADHSSGDGGEVVGQTFDEWGVIAQVLYGGTDEAAMHDLAYGTVLHEIEHLYQAEFLSARRRNDIPGWFLEGDATFFEILQSYDYEDEVRVLAADDALPPLLVDNPADAPQTFGTRFGYDIGYSFFTWLAYRSGDLTYHREIMAALAEDVPFFQALEGVIGLPRMEIEREWRTWLGGTADAPTLIPTWTPLPFLVPPTPMQFGSSN